jgi:hypothetical protein
MSTPAPPVPAHSAGQWVTAAAVGIVACVVADMVHEALGHGTASWLAGDPILSISTVATQNAIASRFVSAAGTTANCIVGALSLLAFGRAKRLTPGALCLWFFGAFNLFNTGYLIVSALLGNGDWANVIAGYSPAWLWRSILGAAGAVLYVYAVRWTVRSMIPFVERGEIDLPQLRQSILAAYLGGGAVMTLASVFNPISPGLILLSGAGASFGLNAGLLFVPAIVAANARGTPAAGRAMPLSLVWVASAVVVGGAFVAVLGPGIRFYH